jgi:hypothetical protein
VRSLLLQTRVLRPFLRPQRASLKHSALHRLCFSKHANTWGTQPRALGHTAASMSMQATPLRHSGMLRSSTSLRMFPPGAYHAARPHAGRPERCDPFGWPCDHRGSVRGCVLAWGLMSRCTAANVLCGRRSEAVRGGSVRLRTHQACCKSKPWDGNHGNWALDARSNAQYRLQLANQRLCGGYGVAISSAYVHADSSQCRRTTRARQVSALCMKTLKPGQHVISLQSGGNVPLRAVAGLAAGFVGCV